MVEWLNGGTTGRKRRCGLQGLGALAESGPTPAGRRVGRGRWVVAPPGFLLWPLKPCSVPAGCERVPSMGSKRRGARSRQGRDGPAPTQCVQAECFDPLVRNCVACKLFRTPEPRPGKSPPTPPAGQRGQPRGGGGGGSRCLCHTLEPRAWLPPAPGWFDGGAVSRGLDGGRPAVPTWPSPLPLFPFPCPPRPALPPLPGPASPPSDPSPPRPSLPSAPCPPSPSPPPAAGASSLAPGTALQPQESVGPGAAAEAEAALPLPALLFGAPALLGLALALVLVGLLSWRWRRRRPHAAAPPGAPAPHPHGKLRGAGAVGGTRAPLGAGRRAGGGGARALGRALRTSGRPVPGRDTTLASQSCPSKRPKAPTLLPSPRISHIASPLCISCPRAPSHATPTHPCRGVSVQGCPSSEASRTGVGKG